MIICLCEPPTQFSVCQFLTQSIGFPSLSDYLTTSAPSCEICVSVNHQRLEMFVSPSP
jgi:hypothetical protein